MVDDIKQTIAEIRNDFRVIRMANIQLVNKLAEKDHKAEVISKDISEYGELLMKIEDRLNSMDNSLHAIMIIIDQQRLLSEKNKKEEEAK